MKPVCSLCGYVHDQDQLPEVCPLCGASRDKFEKKKI